jgi:16S rRNA G527 N7-methylase RsmG
MAKMKPGQVSAKRAYAIADSLDKRESFLDMYKKNLIPINEKGERRIEEYHKNKADASRIRSAADAAMKKANRDYPLSESPNPTFKNQK